MQDTNIRQSDRLAETFPGLAEFLDFLERRPQSTDRGLIQRMAEELKSRGKATTQRFGTVDVAVRGTNYREEITMLGAPCRGMALLDALDRDLSSNSQARVLCCDDSETIVGLLRRCYPNTVGCANAATVKKDPDCPKFSISIAAMGFGSRSFDAVVYAETLNASPDLPFALAESARVLRQGGVMLATFPFDCMSSGGGIVGAVLDWSILDACRQAGFSSAEIIYLADPAGGIIGADTDGIFVLRCSA